MPRIRYDCSRQTYYEVYQEYTVRFERRRYDACANEVLRLDPTDSLFDATTRTLKRDRIRIWGGDHQPPRQTVLSPAQVRDAFMTKGNASVSARRAQALELHAAGYVGPVKPGEARALKNVFNDLGMPDLVRRGWYGQTKTIRTRTTSRYMMRAWLRRNPANTPQNIPVREYKANVLQYCYVFRSPLPEVPFTKFLKLARMYRGDKGGLRAAVKAVLANPDAHKEIETVDAIDVLAGLTGMDG